MWTKVGPFVWHIFGFDDNNSRIQETLTLSKCTDNSIVSKNFKKYLGLIWNTSLFLRLYASPIRNNSLFLRLQAGTIHESNTSHVWTILESNQEHLLVFKATRVCPRVQSVKTPWFLGSTRVQSMSQTPSTRWRSTSPIRKNSLFLRLHHSF